LRRNRATFRAIKIVRLLSASDTPLTLTAISSALGIPKSSAFEILHTLSDERIVEIADSDLKTFRVGLGLLELGMVALSKIDLRREADPFLRELNRLTGETAVLAVEDKGYMVCLDRVEGQSVLRTSVELGSRVPMYCTALGKAVLAAYPEAQALDVAAARRVRKLTPNTLTNIADLRRDLSRTRRRGYAIDNGESNRNVRCVGAPVYSARGKVVAAVSIAAPVSSVDSEKVRQFGALIQKTALSISRRLGFAGRVLYPLGDARARRGRDETSQPARRQDAYVGDGVHPSGPAPVQAARGRSAAFRTPEHPRRLDRVTE